MSFAASAIGRDRSQLKSALRSKLLTYAAGNNHGAMERIADAVDALIDAQPPPREGQAPNAIQVDVGGHFDSSGGNARLELKVLPPSWFVDWPAAPVASPGS